ncbi:DUF2169 domain-containing protein [Chitinimonas arctica]|uniref:DUF2169 domain-containing protein n=1 Tax=Chitinimonas arctica TaxID=2594795 RepID=A0A516SHJ7_9NEIS|nr:DUF2169 domain-containing protein [Chitinimonas arctica]QDQ27518.1 DUF2169 domain-containing protein [Chitinimonas arctica]
MEVINGSRYLLDASQALDGEGRPWLVVMAKASWQIETRDDGPPRLAEVQRGFLASDLFEGEPGLSAAHIESDFVFRKQACDVIFKGSAHAPKGRPVRELEAGIKLGPIQKIVRVLGDRQWQRRLGGFWSLGSAEPFLSLPVSYGNAFGGLYTAEHIQSDDPKDFLAHPANLVGRGYAKGKFLSLLEGKLGPNIEAHNERVDSPETLYTPVSLGPIARNWAPRLALAGTYDEQWRNEVFPLLPADFDERFYQCAPLDQQIPFPRGGEQLVLLNLTPGGGVTPFTLPSLDLPMVALPANRHPVVLHPVVDTLVIDTDTMTIDVVWRASLPLSRGLHEIHTVAAGSICKRWWKSRVYGAEDCGCHGVETDDKDLAPVDTALVDDELDSESEAA